MLKNVSELIQLTEANLESIVATCRENTEAIAESLNQCFDRNYRVEVKEANGWDADQLLSEYGGPGLIVGIEIGSQAILCLVPATLPLPPWYTDPNDSEDSRLQTLPMEWSFVMLPPDLEAAN